jgi:type I restriction enzyme, S subunit
MQQRLLALAGAGATRDALTKAMIESLEIRAPGIEDQCAIAGILGALDSKIELNRRVNETLEAIARAIFKSWFVDFDPVRTKVNGNTPPHLPQAIVELFPASSQGGIPNGWSYRTLRDIANINARQLKITDRDHLIRYMDIASSKRGEILESQSISLREAPSRARRLVTDGDTVVSTVRPGNRAYFFVVDPDPNLVVSTGYAVLTPNSNCSALVYLAATNDDAIDYLDHVADGGAYPAVRPEQVGALEVLWPGEKVAAAFEQLALPMLRRIAANQHESMTLSSIRNSLLPKLISGEIHLKEAKESIGALI